MTSPETVVRRFSFMRRHAFLSSVLAITLPLLLIAGCAIAPSQQGLNTSGQEYVWPKPPAPARIKLVTQWASRNDFGKPSEVLEFLVGKERVEKLQRPNGVIADDAGNVYVVDSAMRQIFVFDVEKKKLRFLGAGIFAGPIGIALDSKRRILYVSDSRLDKVFGLNSETGDVVMTLGGPGEFKNPSGMVFDEQKDLLYIADTQNHVVKIFDREGKRVSTIGRRGQENGEFNFPSYLALDRNNRLYVVDSFNFRVQIFDSDGRFLKKFGKLGDTSGTLSRPMGIGVDSDGNIYVIDAAFNNFQIFNDTGRLLLWVGNAGAKPGEFYMPSGMFIDNSDRIYVSDTFNRRIQVFQYLKAQE
ncbi:MAG: 6-bladed beta-propeller [Nitrospirota bacterium]